MQEGAAAAPAAAKGMAGLVVVLQVVVENEGEEVEGAASGTAKTSGKMHSAGSRN